MQLILWFLCVCVTWIWCNIKNLKRLEFLYRSNVLEPQEDSHVNLQLSIFISFSALETFIPRPFLKTPRSEYWKKETALSPTSRVDSDRLLFWGGFGPFSGHFFFEKVWGGQSPFRTAMIRTSHGPVGLRHARDPETIKPSSSNDKKEVGAEGRRGSGKLGGDVYIYIYIYIIDFLLSSLFRGNDPIWRPCISNGWLNHQLLKGL